MVRPQTGRNAQLMRFVLAVFLAAIFFRALAGMAQAPNNQAPANQAPPPSNPGPATVPQSISGILQPSLDTVSQTLQSLRMDKWKKGSIRDEAGTNINSIQNDLRSNLPPLLQDADAAPATVTRLLPVARHVAALYDVLLRVTEASRISGPDDQAAQLQQALLSLSNARIALDTRIQLSAGAEEKQVIDLRTSIQTEAARRAAQPAPVALPCVPPPPAKKPVRKRAPAAKPVAKPSTTTTPSTTPSNTKPAQPTTTH